LQRGFFSWCINRTCLPQRKWGLLLTAFAQNNPWIGVIWTNLIENAVVHVHGSSYLCHENKALWTSVYILIAMSLYLQCYVL
jgi:hypothetical protein